MPYTTAPESVNRRIRNELSRLHAAIVETLYNDTVTLEELEYFSYWIEQLLRHLIQLSDNGLVTVECVHILQDVFYSFQNFCTSDGLHRSTQTDCPHMELIREKALGRPRYLLTKEQLEFLISLGFNKNQLSQMLGVSSRTIQRRMTEFGLSSAVKYTDLTEEELDDMVKQMQQQFPQAGYRQVLSLLKCQGVFVRERQLRESMQRCDPVGTSLRWFATVERRHYSVAGPLALWHIDGNHKLIRWKLVIHGAIDGYSRLIVFLRCSHNNRAQTVLRLFEEAVAEFGLPSRVRTDKGGENTALALYMLEHPLRGPGRGSVLTGSSTHNQRIERLWRDVYSGVLCFYKSIFYHLEEENVLDPLNDSDVLALHTVFIPRINRHIEIWKEGWNSHRMRTAGSLSPLQQFVNGLLRMRETDSELARETFYVPEEHLDTYGIDWDGPVPIDSSASDALPHVEVPELQLSLTDQEKRGLIECMDPLSNSSCYGIDLYLQARDFLQSCSSN